MSLCVGVPRETKPLEGRVALTPAAAAELVSRDVQVATQSGAGMGSGYADADTLYDRAQLVVKVKEPVGAEIDRLKPGHLLFRYLHLAANPDLTARLCDNCRPVRSRAAPHRPCL